MTGEYARFVRYLDAQIEAGDTEEVPVDSTYGRGEIYGGRWFKVRDTGAIWRLVPPDPPFNGLWEPVK